MKIHFNIGTLNVRTLNSNIRQYQLSEDTEKYNLDVLCLQETKIQNGVDITTNAGRLICFPSASRFYGCGYFISKKWKQYIHRTWKVSDRVCVLQLIGDKIQSNPVSKQGKTTSISIINVYAPTKERAEKHPEELKRFYKDLDTTIEELGNKTLLIIAGDFNAKVGKREEGECCLGAHSKGRRNENGENLVEFCKERKLFITNSAFNHASRHITTWVGQRRDKQTGSIVNIYNQIDYILCRQRHKNFTTNSRSYAGTLLTTDHKLVKTNFVIEWHKHHCLNNTTNNEPKINIVNIVNNTQCRKQYQRLLDTRLDELIYDNSTANESWSSLHEVITKTAIQVAGTITNKRGRRTYDPTTAQLSSEQKELRIRIQNSKQEKERQILKGRRNKILHQIRERVIRLRNEELDKKVDNINRSNNDQAMYKAVRLLNQKPSVNPKVEDDTGKLITDPNTIVDVLSTFYKSRFYNKDTQHISSYEGKPRPLFKPITSREVRQAVTSLNNNRAPGGDGLCAELLKYGPPQLEEHIADIFNQAFKNHQPLDINRGNLIAIQKPGKSRGPPQNLRPITLLNTIRKTLSVITLNRIRPFVERYISNSQSGFRPERSTADVVWAHKWLAAKTLSEKVEITITGIDMSAAFDTINRQTLLNILKDLLHEDETRLIRFLMSETWITTKVNGASKKFPFLSNVGTPQGDSLSPVLFIVYMEHALKDVRNSLTTTRSMSQFEKLIPQEIAYADDIDFIGLNQVDITDIKSTLQKYKLYVNTEKTEITTLSRKEDGWRTTKKVGSLIGDKEDVERRKMLSTNALNKLMNVWIRKDKVKTSVKIKLYTSLVKSILIYNCGTWALTQTEEKRLDSFHRKQLRKVLNIRYPTKISNEALYSKCNESPLSMQILAARWGLFGHILRRDNDIPANKSMNAFFTTSGQGKYKGRPPTTIYTVLNRDLKHLQSQPRLKSKEDLSSLRNLAEDREKWRDFIQRIKEAAEAPQSDD